MKTLLCPNCSKPDFFALESVAAKTPVALFGERDKDDKLIVEIEEIGMGEFIRDDATSVTTAYLCANEECNTAFSPVDLGDLKEGEDEQTQKA